MPALHRCVPATAHRSEAARPQPGRSEVRFKLRRALPAGEATDRAQYGGPGVSDIALMDITPALAAVVPQRDGDGMIGLLIVRLGVPVGGVVGTGHPATGQAQPQPHPAASTIKALQTLGRVWLDRAGAGEVTARLEVVEIAARLGCSWHRVPRTAVL